ncbi:hypothetical protein LNQ82_01685 [Conchiformibius steedae DSM 2580]|uniref:Uncharacterized protein n=1 Tax=Conchiformibius steedae DSM 2580 TaxID=1121352 RepID=A0AAE9L0H0_9NEIS|nr:hypothetical protein [Conchiformibius steedae]QMT33259.1 hypothetical protein H3L98_09225 [Conchiformibius steedae]URD67900.1 hypothetical protein LNQ82_01685 [Conchiformibius steedae DSM 2580]
MSAKLQGWGRQSVFCPSVAVGFLSPYSLAKQQLSRLQSAWDSDTADNARYTG